MSELSTLTVLNAFKDVYDCWKLSSPATLECYPSHRYLMNKYHLTIGSVEAIAYLLHFHPTEISYHKLRIIPHNRNESALTVFEDLKDRKFIEVRKKEGLGGNCYAISDAAYSAFSENKEFGEAPVFDCYEELSTCSENCPCSSLWLKEFHSALETENNRKFKEAYQKLGLSSLSTMAETAFWLITRFFIHNFAAAFRIMDVAINEEEVYAQLGILAKAGLVIMLPSDVDGQSRSEYVLAPKAAGLLFQGHEEIIKYDELGKYADLIKNQDIEKKELFFSNDAQEEIDHLRKMVSSKGFLRVKEVQSRKKRAGSVISLLWGTPGTGKTETVKQLALEAGRDVLKVDMAKITGYCWGATEKYYRALFRAYNYVTAISDNVPILLLNEADAILCKRLTHVEKAIDRSENIVSDILLEEVENLNGILLATTNLIDNIDPAFDRRFLFKTRLIKPDASARAKIWKSSIPELTEEEARKLAEHFEMSGAQIDNVVVKRDLAELYYDGNRDYGYIVKLCEKELSTESGSKPFRPRIGF